MKMEALQPNNTVLIVTDDLEKIQTFSEQLKAKIPNITSKNYKDIENLGSAASYDFVINYFVTPIEDISPTLSALLKVTKPGANIVVRQESGDADKWTSQLKLSGFSNISSPKIISEEKKLIEISCVKPNFEVGSSAPLNFKRSSDVSKVWKLDATVDDEVETIDPDELLDEDDLKKPDKSLKVCSTTGKRKACKDCSCGLAEELAAEKGEATSTNKDMPKSSCGSCYLGDAFRCASCPYLGMPAFKPGEKIELSANQLKADI